MACLTPRKGTSEFRPVIPNAPKKAPQALGQFQKLTRQDIWLAATCKERLNKAAPQRKHMTSVLSDDDEDNLGSEEESGEEPLLMDCSRDRNNEPTELDPSPAKKQDEKTEEETEKQVKEIETRKQELGKALKQVQKENAKLQKAIELAEAEIKELEFISMEEPETETKQEAIQRRGVYTAGCFAAVHFMYPLGLLTKSHQGTIGFAKVTFSPQCCLSCVFPDVYGRGGYRGK
jgi:vacuolar-type H+-ATPase subunit I/STV1